MTFDEQLDQAAAKVVEDVKKGPHAHETRRDKVERYGLYALALGLAIAFLWIYVVKGQANDAKRYAQATCPLIYTLSQAPLPDNPQAFSLTIAAGLRVTYDNENCEQSTGRRLPAADPRLQPYIAKVKAFNLHVAP